MKRYTLSNLIVYLLVVALITIYLSISQVFALTYNITDLGTLGGTYSYAWDLNNSGQVVGVSTTVNGDWHAFLWTQGEGMCDIGTLANGDYSYAQHISNISQIAGYSNLTSGGSTRHAYICEGDVMTDLDLSFDKNSYAHGINDVGQVVGNVDKKAFIWDSVNGVQYIGPPGVERSSAQAINNSGQVVGNYLSNNTFGFIWDSLNGIRNLEMPVGYKGSVPEDINEAGQVAGHAWTDIAPHPHYAFIWNDVDDMHRICDVQSRAQGINDAGQVIGEFSVGGNYSHAFIWDSGHGLRDLNDQILSGSNFEFISSAKNINNTGQIIAQGRINDSWHAVLLSPAPIPEPSTCLLFLFGLVGIAFIKKKIG